MPSSAPSVTRETVSCDRSTPVVCRTCRAMSRTLIPLAYSEVITASRPSDLRACLGTSTGAKLPSRSRGTATRTGPTSVFSVLTLDPFRRFSVPPPSSRCASSSAASPACSTCPITPVSSPPGPVSVTGSPHRARSASCPASAASASSGSTSPPPASPSAGPPENPPAGSSTSPGRSSSIDILTSPWSRPPLVACGNAPVYHPRTNFLTLPAAGPLAAAGHAGPSPRPVAERTPAAARCP